MDPARPAVFVIAGPPRSGKSTVARILIARFACGVHLEVDTVPATATPPDLPGSLPAALLRVVAEADRAVDEGSTVALEVAARAALLGECRTAIRSRPCHVIVLMPADRPPDSDDAFVTAPRVGTWLDPFARTPEQTVDAILATTHTSSARVDVSDYDPAWPAMFEELAAPLRGAVAGLVVAIEHVGSTAVPGLAAKPVIDLDVVVASAADVPAAIERLRASGYVYQGEKGIPGRAAFLSPRGTPPHHLYVVVAGSRPHRDHVRFRDYLRGHPAAAGEYAALKRSLAERLGDDRAGYTAAKSAFVEEALARADG